MRRRFIALLLAGLLLLGIGDAFAFAGTTCGATRLPATASHVATGMHMQVRTANCR